VIQKRKEVCHEKRKKPTRPSTPCPAKRVPQTNRSRSNGPTRGGRGKNCERLNRGFAGRKEKSAFDKRGEPKRKSGGGEKRGNNGLGPVGY